MSEISINADGTFVTTMLPCKKCGMVRFVRMYRDIISSGASQIYWFCSEHEGGITSPRQSLSHEWVRKQGIVIDKLPVRNNGSNLMVCCICGAIGAENHHWAPRHLFHDECEKWPQSPLCVPCHLRWHNVVTPRMKEK
jgi:hypothetical protein